MNINGGVTSGWRAANNMREWLTLQGHMCALPVVDLRSEGHQTTAQPAR
jgi:hypothetical protein